MATDDKALALMVYETWLLSGKLPNVKLQRWVNKKLRRKMFPETMAEGGAS
jgi:hypothetical protein